MQTSSCTLPITSAFCTVSTFFDLSSIAREPMTSAFRTVSTFFDLSAIARERNHMISRTFAQFRTHRCAKVAKRTKCYIDGASLILFILWNTANLVCQNLVSRRISLACIEACSALKPNPCTGLYENKPGFYPRLYGTLVMPRARLLHSV